MSERLTPFGTRVRQLRSQRGITQKQMAADLGVAAAYLSALEKGQRGMPNWTFVQRVIGYFNIIWDEAEELQALAAISHPRITIDTSGLSAEATMLANTLARNIQDIDEKDLQRLRKEIESLSKSSQRGGKR